MIRDEGAMEMVASTENLVNKMEPLKRFLETLPKFGEINYIKEGLDNLKRPLQPP